MAEQKFSFRSVNFDDDKDREQALAFRRDALDEGVWEEEGGDKSYLESRREMVSRDPETVEFFLVDGSIAGMIEFDGREIDGKLYGYGYFYYLSPEHRGKGYGPLLDEQVCGKLKERGHETARLTTLANNTQAVNFYVRQGWSMLGRRQTAHKEIIYLEKDLTDA